LTKYRAKCRHESEFLPLVTKSFVSAADEEKLPRWWIYLFEHMYKQLSKYGNTSRMTDMVSIKDWKNVH